MTSFSVIIHERLGWCPHAPAIRTAPSALGVSPENVHTAQPGDGGADGSPGREWRGVCIAVESLKAMGRDRRLLGFTALAGVVMLFLIAVEANIAAQVKSIVPSPDTPLSHMFTYSLGDFLVLFDMRFFSLSIHAGDSFLSFDLRLLGIEMICLSCFTILLAGLVLYRRENGAQQPVTIRGILHDIRPHGTTLATLSVAIALSAMLMYAVISTSPFFGKSVSAIEMAVFNLPYAYYLQGEPIYSALLYSFEIMFINILLFLAAFYIVPVIVLEKRALLAALAGSVSLMRKTWREMLGCAIIYGTIVLGMATVAVVIGQSPFLLNRDYDFFINMSRGQPLVVAVCFLFLIVCWGMMAAGFTAGGIAIADLYGCGKTGTVRGGEPQYPRTTTPTKDQSASECRSKNLNG